MHMFALYRIQMTKDRRLLLLEQFSTLSDGTCVPSARNETLLRSLKTVTRNISRRQQLHWLKRLTSSTGNGWKGMHLAQHTRKQQLKFRVGFEVTQRKSSTSEAGEQSWRFNDFSGGNESKMQRGRSSDLLEKFMPKIMPLENFSKHIELFRSSFERF